MTLRPQVLRVLLSLCLILFFSAAAFPAKKKPPLKPVNINTATSEENFSKCRERTGNGAENLADAQVLRRIQECR
jgi:hypothetical protein